MQPDITGTLRPLQEADLPTLLTWRNHPAVRSVMFHRQPINLAEHSAWFARQLQLPGRHLLIYEEAGLALGHVNFTLLPSSQIAEWGFYRAPDAPGGSGRRMGCAALDWAFQTLALHKLFAQVLADNPRSLGFHEALGFKQEGVLREQYHDGSRYLNLHCFGLLRSEWQAMKGNQHE